MLNRESIASSVIKVEARDERLEARDERLDAVFTQLLAPSP